ncbi:MAG: hypothetical protein WCA12_12745, partial [Burkholderiales bacterium]
MAQENSNDAKKTLQRYPSEEDGRRRLRTFRPAKSWQFQVGAGKYFPQWGGIMSESKSQSPTRGIQSPTRNG